MTLDGSINAVGSSLSAGAAGDGSPIACDFVKKLYMWVIHSRSFRSLIKNLHVQDARRGGIPFCRFLGPTGRLFRCPGGYRLLALYRPFPSFVDAYLSIHLSS